MSTQPPVYTENNLPTEYEGTLGNHPYEKLMPEFRVLVYPPEALPAYTPEVYGISDNISSLMKRDQGDSAADGKLSIASYWTISGSPHKEISALAETAEVVDLRGAGVDAILGGEAWSGNPEFEDIYNLRFVKLTTLFADGAAVSAEARESISERGGSTFSGFCLKPVAELKSCVFPKQETISIFFEDGSEGIAPQNFWRTAQGEKGIEELEWRVMQPKEPPKNAVEGSDLERNKGWEIIQSYGQRSTGIQLALQLPNKSAIIETSERLQANQQFEFELEWLGKAANHDGAAGWRVSWGDDTYSLVFREGVEPCIDRYRNQRWETWRKLESAAKTDFKRQGHFKVSISRLAGRLVVQIDEQGWCISNAKSTFAGGQERQWSTASTDWRKGKIRITSFGALFAMRSFSLLSYRKPKLDRRGNPEKDKDGNAVYRPVWGAFARMARVQLPDDGAYDSLEAKVAMGGYQTSSAWIKFADGVLPLNPQFGYYNSAYYVVVMRASEDGTDTPFVHSLAVEIMRPAVDTDIEPIDISSCLISVSESSQERGAASAADWSFELSPDLLDNEFGTDQNGRGLWERYIKQWNIIEFSVRWIYDTCPRTYSGWVKRLRGHIVSEARSAAPANVRRLSFRAQDPTIRLMGNNSVIDSRFLPLDFLLAQKAGQPLYGADCIYQILKTALGTKEANKINGNTTGAEPTLAQKLKYFMPAHYAIMSPSTDAGGFLPVQWQSSGQPSTGGFLFPAPYGQPAMSWISQIANFDFAIFYYGFPADFSKTAPDESHEDREMVPIYGHYYTLIKDRPTWRIPDANYVDKDVNLLLQNASWSDMPEYQYNNFYVWNNPPGANTNSLPFPTIIQGAARLVPPDPNSSYYSWRRTLVENEPMAFLPGVAEAKAAILRDYWANQHIRRVSLEFVGEPLMDWGDKVIPMMINNQEGDFSPSFLDMSGETFRVIKVSNTYKDDAAGVFGFMTRAGCAPFNPDME